MWKRAEEVCWSIKFKRGVNEVRATRFIVTGVELAEVTLRRGTGLT